MDIENLYKSEPEKPALVKLTPDEIRTVYRSFIISRDIGERFVETHENDDPGRELWIDRLESLKKLIDRWEREFSNYSLDTVGDD